MVIYPEKNSEGFIGACDLNIIVNKMVRYAKVSRNAYKYFDTERMCIYFKKKLRSPFCHCFPRFKLLNESTNAHETTHENAVTMENIPLFLFPIYDNRKRNIMDSRVNE